jgi:hypothetical protein
MFETNQGVNVENIQVYYSSNANMKYQHSDEKSLTIGGGSEMEGNSAIFVS